MEHTLLQLSHGRNRDGVTTVPAQSWLSLAHTVVL